MAKKKTSLQKAIESEITADFLSHNIEVSALGDLDIDTQSEEQVAERIGNYFVICAKNNMRPSIPGLALAFGVTRQELMSWISGTVKKPVGVQYLLKKAFGILNAVMEDYAQNGMIDKVMGIFLLKNHFGYEDKKELTVAAPDPFGDDTTPEELRQKYLGAIDVQSFRVKGEPDNADPAEGADREPIPNRGFYREDTERNSEEKTE